MALYNGANREVAILCNHQKTVSSAQKEGLEKLHDRLAMLKKQKKVRFLFCSVLFCGGVLCFFLKNWCRVFKYWRAWYEYRRVCRR